MITIIGKFSDTRYGWHAASASKDTTTTTRRARSTGDTVPCSARCLRLPAMVAFIAEAHKERPPQRTATLLPRGERHCSLLHTDAPRPDAPTCCRTGDDALHRRRARSVYTARRLKLCVGWAKSPCSMCAARVHQLERAVPMTCTMTCTMTCAYGWCGLWAEDAGARPGCACRVCCPLV